MKKRHARKWADMIGQAMAGNGRLADGMTLLNKYPERYANPFTDWIDLLIAETRAKAGLKESEKKQVFLYPHLARSKLDFSQGVLEKMDKFMTEQLLLPGIEEVSFAVIEKPVVRVKRPSLPCKHGEKYVTSYCNFTHCLQCGCPIRHECCRLHPKILQLERDSTYEWLIPSARELMEVAQPQYSKNVDKERNTLRQWFCPLEIARIMADLADMYCRSGSRWSPDILEPSCGAGILLASMFSPHTGRLVGLDVCPQPNWEELSRYGLEFYDSSSWGAAGMGSLEFNQEIAAQVNVPPEYDIIMMHPPFGGLSGSSDRGTSAMRSILSWARTQRYFDGWSFDVYAVFMRHFVRFLKPGGVMIALTPRGWAYNSTAEKMRRAIIEESEDIWLVAQADLGGVRLWKDANVDCIVSVIRRGVKPLNDEIIFYDLRRRTLAEIDRLPLPYPKDYYPFDLELKHAL